MSNNKSKYTLKFRKSYLRILSSLVFIKVKFILKCRA